MIRLLPVYLQDTRRCQQYFADMSSKGYHLKKVWPPFAIFEKGEPVEYEYRIRALYDYKLFRWYFFGFWYKSIGKPPTPAKMDHFKQAGFNLICQFQNLYIFRAKKHEVEFEVPADSMEEERIKKLPFNSRLFVNNIKALLFFAFFSLVFVYNKSTIYSLVSEPAFVLFILLFLRLLIGVIRRIILSAQILNEIYLPIDEIEGWELKRIKKRAFSWAINIIFIAAFLIYLRIL